MKKIKDRPMTPLLMRQLKQQEERIKQCGISAIMKFNSQVSYAESVYSKRLAR